MLIDCARKEQPVINIFISEQQADSILTYLPLGDTTFYDFTKGNMQSTGVATDLATTLLLATDKPVIFRTPVVPSVNANAEDIGAIAAYIRELGNLRKDSGSPAPPPSLDLLPFHRLASDKYRSLGLEYKARDFVTPTKEEMAALLDVALAYGIDVKSHLPDR